MSEDRPSLSEAELRFHIEEYKALRNEVDQSHKAQFDAYVYCLLANGALISIFLTQKAALLAYGPTVPKIAAAVPLIVTLLGLFWSSHFTWILNNIAAYFDLLEERVASSGLGWERYI